MASMEDARYRLALAQGFLKEAREDLGLKRWRSCVDNSQLATENAGKSVLALLGPVGHTHGTADAVRQTLQSGRFAPSASGWVTRLAELAERLGWDVHVASDYGDELGRKTPWELFDEAAAQQALTVADEAVTLAGRVVDEGLAP